jgi:hypothetical protein
VGETTAQVEPEVAAQAVSDVTVMDAVPAVQATFWAVGLTVVADVAPT